MMLSELDTKTTLQSQRTCLVGSVLAVVEADGAHLNPDDANQERLQMTVSMR
jgi:hypothetical protein